MQRADGKFYYNHTMRHPWALGDEDLLQGAPAEHPSKAGGATTGRAQEPAAHAYPTSARPSEPNVSQGTDDLNLQILPLGQRQRGSFSYVTPEELAQGRVTTIRIGADGNVSTSRPRRTKTATSFSSRLTRR